MNDLTVRERTALNTMTKYMRGMQLGEMIQSLIDNVNVDVGFATPKNAVNSTGTLTVATQPTAGDVMTLGSKRYTFVANGAAALDGDISVATDLASAKLAIVAAINGTDSINEPNPELTASVFAVNITTLTAIVAGVLGDSIGLVGTFTAGGNLLSGASLANGVNGTVAKQGTILVDASYVYFSVDDNSIIGKNWRRVSLGSAF